MNSRHPLTHRIARLANSTRKALAGLRLHSESVWPGVRNDVFVAHSSIYNFFARYAERRRILDAGCGTGYGAARLADRGGKEIWA